MSESASHRRAKRRAAGFSGRTEVPLPGGGRLDAATRRRAYEVERSGNMQRLVKAAERLARSNRPQRILQVPDGDMSKATQAMRQAGVCGTVTNLTGTRRRWVQGCRRR